MDNILKYLRCICLFYLFPASSSHAGAWLQAKGEGLVIGNAQYYNSCKYWDKQGNLHNGPCFEQFSVTPYAEYGLLDKLTLILSPNFDTFSQSNNRVPFGFENFFFAGRYSLWKKDWSQLSAQLGYNQPIRTSKFGNVITATPSSVYAIINRQRFIDARLLYGTGGTFDKENYNTWYADVEGAYQPNFSGGATEFRINLMLGWKTKGGQLIFELQELNALTANDATDPTAPSYNLSTVMVDTIYWFKSNIAAIQIGIQQDFYGKNIGQGTAPFIALWWRFK